MEPQCCSCAFIWSARIVIEYRCLHCHVNVHSQDEIGFANTVPMYAPAYTNVLILVRSLDGTHREMMAWNAGKVTPSPNLRHYDKSSEYAAARQHKVAEVACYRIEGTLMGCADPPSKGVGASHQCSRLNKKRSGWGESVTYLRFQQDPLPKGSRSCPSEALRAVQS